MSDRLFKVPGSAREHDAPLWDREPGKRNLYGFNLANRAERNMETGGSISDTCCNSFSEANQIMTTSNSGSMMQAAAMIAVLGGR